MTKKDIDNIVWWIPFKKTRHSVREILMNIAPPPPPNYDNLITLNEAVEHLSYCNICKQKSVFKHFGRNKRPYAKCPNCGSLERHRYYFPAYEKYISENTNSKNLIPLKLLHTAPEKCLSDIFSKNTNIEYYPIDLSPERYKHINCYKADVTDLGCKNNYFDTIISNHVLEHILDEDKFFSEMLRVLKPGGTLFLSIPIIQEKTFQDTSIISWKDRLKHYKQGDHVIAYGRDVIKKFEDKYGAIAHKCGETLFEIRKPN